ncbi:MAG: hypothetical protein QNJ40_16055 [Xanthomonadales bacterium]|nr:hypothetical protein [Xanthomonadales bacterium]
MLRLIFGAGLLWAAFAVSAPLGTSVTYQGLLQQSGSPANGVFDFEIRIFDAGSDGLELAAPIVAEDVTVTDGLFTLDLDFGPMVFDGEAVWVDIAVRPGIEVGTFTGLAPRQAVRASPYALFALAGNEGPPGPAGPPGDQGPQGETGPPGDSHWTRVNDDTFFAAGNVGIGTPVPGTALDIAGVLRVSPDSGLATGLQLRGLGGVPLLDVGEGGVGIGEPAPLAPLHLVRQDIGIDTNALVNDDLVVEDEDGQVGIYSSGAGSAGSALSFKEIDQAALVDHWGIYRLTSAADSHLRFTYGTSANYNNNPVLVSMQPSATTLNFFVGRTLAAMPLDMIGSSILGGFNNVVTDSYSTVAGGLNNQAGDNAGTSTDSRFASVGGGFGNQSEGYASLVGGGEFNLVQGPHNAVGGGDSNQILGAQSIIAGGANNMITSASATVSGGVLNRVEAEAGVVGGGSSNAATGAFATVPGGSGNVAGGDRSWAGGSLAIVRDAAAAGEADINGDCNVAGGLCGDEHSFVWNGDLPENGVFQSTAPHQFLINAPGGFGLNRNEPAHPVHVGTDTSNGNGAHLTAGGTWTNASSRDFKTEVQDVAPERVLDAVMKLNISRWRYRDAPDGDHLGPMAEDFSALFQLGSNPRYISSVDADGVALAAIQGLHMKLQREISALRAQNQQLQAEIQALRK